MTKYAGHQSFYEVFERNTGRCLARGRDLLESLGVEVKRQMIG